MRKILIHMLAYIILIIIITPILIGLVLIVGGEDANVFRYIICGYCFIVYVILVDKLKDKDLEIKRLKDILNRNKEVEK